MDWAIPIIGTAITCNGKDSSGLSRADTASLALEDYRSVVLNNFDLSSLLQPVHLYNLDNVDDDDEDEPSLQQYSLRPRPTPTRSYQITTLDRLATFRPKSRPSVPVQGQKSYGVEANRRSRRLQRKRDEDRAKRAEKRFLTQVRLGCSIKAHQLSHVRETESKAVKVDFDLNGSIAEAPTWTGLQDQEEGRHVTLEAVRKMPGFQVFANDGRKTADNGLNEAIQAFCDSQDEEIKQIASEFKTSLLNVKKRVGIHRRYRENRKSSLYNALMHKKAQEDRLAGVSMLTLKERHAAMDEDQDIQDILNEPDGEEALQAMADLKAHQQAKIMGARSSSKANDNDIVKTWGDLAQRAENLSKRTSAATFGFVCSSKAGQNVTRQFFGNGPIEVQDEWGRVCRGCRGVLHLHLKRKDRKWNGGEEHAEGGFKNNRNVTGNPKLNMEYDHYEYLIVYEYGVQLMGWPSGVEMISPHKLTAPDAIKVYQAVEFRSCQWRKVDGVKLHQIKKSIDARIKSKELALPECRQQGKKRPARNQGGGRTTKKKRLATATASVDRSKKTKSTRSKKSTSNPKRRRIVHSDEEDFEIDSGNNSTNKENDSDNEDNSNIKNDGNNGDRDDRDNRNSNNNGHNSGDDNDRNQLKL
ncbi:hypothetical protein C8R42DRAFT_717215 [Lentinula raphanica]|nr:hypothetical protein C8R42DRAFT_717215 [Lentinula raphanica]